jgi:hypothetical protein
MGMCVIRRRGHSVPPKPQPTPRTIGRTIARYAAFKPEGVSHRGRPGELDQAGFAESVEAAGHARPTNCLAARDRTGADMGAG